MHGYQDRVAVVTGGASGIGRALCERLGREGAVVLVADVAAEGAEAVAEGIRQAGGRAEAVAVDVRDAAQVEALVARAFDGHGRLDLMVNNAGIALAGEVHTVTLDEWDRILDVNLKGVIHGVHAAYPRMMAQGFGQVVNMASYLGLVPMPGLAAYAMTKHAVLGLSLSLRAEAAARGVKVTVVCPGFVRTPLLEGGPVRGLEAADPADALKQVWPFPLMEPDALVEEVLRGLARNQPLIVTPRPARIMWRVYRFFPRWTVRQLEKALAKQARQGQLGAGGEAPG